MLDFTPRAVYRGQIATLEHALRVKNTQIEQQNRVIADLRTEVNTADSAIRNLNNEVKRLVNEGEQQKIVTRNIIDEKRKKIRDLEKEVARLRIELNNEFDKTAKPEPKPMPKPKFTRAKNGRFAKQAD